MPWDQWARINWTALCLEEFARWRYQLDVRQLQCLFEFVRMRHRRRSLLSTITLFALFTFHIFVILNLYKTVDFASPGSAVSCNFAELRVRHGSIFETQPIPKFLHPTQPNPILTQTTVDTRQSQVDHTSSCTHA